ncbi:class I glutamine amidotransferase-like protein [Daldinia vernicosa]|uniref:class I glutamine amidotransferase-like protein n=1 Tax=Daldinia vernicosa TaxID=114800 RepID=UPI002008A9C7|nr:class I glutamine amidotransferase-like protein [Daldinia vernicosa]KAI0848896.1 class I glutamine amidotransferase-like protein [Daldinia vernicosa]
MAAANANGSARHTVRVGVFIPTMCQLLDAASVDIIGSMSYEYMTAFRHLLPEPVIDLAPFVEIHYIGSVRAGEHITLTSNESILATDHYSDAAVAPGKLDIVLVPGPDPASHPEAAALEWLSAQADTPGVDILSVCTGIFICGEAGLLRGKRACGPRALQDMIRQRGFGEKELIGDKYRWVQDGNLWSGGGVTNGNDLVAAYCRATPRHFARPTVEMAIETMEVGDRGREYSDGQTEASLKKKIEDIIAEANAIIAAKN